MYHIISYRFLKCLLRLVLRLKSKLFIPFLVIFWVFFFQYPFFPNLLVIVQQVSQVGVPFWLHFDLLLLDCIILPAQWNKEEIMHGWNLINNPCALCKCRNVNGQCTSSSVHLHQDNLNINKFFPYTTSLALALLWWWYNYTAPMRRQLLLRVNYTLPLNAIRKNYVTLL